MTAISFTSVVGVFCQAYPIPKTPEDLRICDHCSLDSVELKCNYQLFHCDLHDDLRKTLFIIINERNALYLQITITRIKSVFFSTILIRISAG